ncbi:MAG TPA: hypothetical protein VIO94_13465 [Phenylobacterium sp.]
MLAVQISIALACAPVAPTAPLIFAEAAVVDHPMITLADVADVSSLPQTIRMRAAALELARFRRPGVLVLPATVVSERLRSQLPALASWLPSGARADVVIRYRAVLAPAPEAGRPTRPCQRVLRAISSGEAVLAGDLEPADCGAEPRAGVFRFDGPAGVLRAVTDIAAEDRVGAVPASALAAVAPGQALYLQTRVGPVTVERAVEVVRAARKGEPVFVRGAEGRVFSVPAPADVR